MRKTPMAATHLLAFLVLSSMWLAPGAKPLPSLSRLVALARPFVEDAQRHKNVPIRDRLPVMFLNSVNGPQTLTYPQTSLYKSITLLLKFVAPMTPLDIYLFCPERLAPPDPAVHGFNAIAPNIAVLPLLADHWHRRHRDNYMQDSQLDVTDYHIMGQWRLEVQFTFAAMMGYEYVFQFDDDSYVLGPVPYNILDRLRQTNALMAGQSVLKDPPFFFNGLPELARAFIVMHSGEHARIYDRAVPPQHRLNVSSQLYKHCNPPSINGLHTTMNDTGFDNSYVFGNCLIVKSDLWQEPLVQDFIQLCLLSGGVYRYRWNEQAVIAFIWLMFVEENQFLLLQDIPYKHGRPYMTGEEWSAFMNGTTPTP